MQLSKYEEDSINKFGKSVQNGQWSNEGLLQLIEVAGNFLNLQTIPRYQEKTGMSYNGVKDYRNVHKIFGVKMVIDNE
ncbi:MAG: hypothetical protein R6U85_10935 [Salinivirgaceae bacterium]